MSVTLKFYYEAWLYLVTTNHILMMLQLSEGHLVLSNVMRTELYFVTINHISIDVCHKLWWLVYKEMKKVYSYILSPTLFSNVIFLVLLGFLFSSTNYFLLEILYTTGTFVFPVNTLLFGLRECRIVFVYHLVRCIYVIYTLLNIHDFILSF